MTESAKHSLASGIAESPGRDVGFAESGCRIFAPNADISLAVIHKLAKKPAPARHSSSNSKLVNNCAAGKNCGGGRPASARSQSPRSNRKTVSERLLGEPKALASTSNRKTPQEGHHISLVDSRAKRRKNQRQQKPMNESEQWKQYRAFGAVDWASAKHSVVIVDQAGRVVEDFEIEHSALGWKKFREKLQSYGSIPIAIETSRGAAVEQLLEAGMIVYPLNPKSARPTANAKLPVGLKTIDWMLGVLLMPCGLMAKTGKHSGQRSR